MANDVAVDIRISNDKASLSLAVANAISDVVLDSVRRSGKCSILLAGGSTPRIIYRHLAAEFSDVIPWEKVHLFWGDERYVDRADPDSNYRMVMESMSNVPFTREQIHPIPTSYSDSAEAALAYQHELCLWFGGKLPQFDIVLLGLGTDGHTASIFPGFDEAIDPHKWVEATRSPVEPYSRISLTFPVFNAGRNVFFIIAGESKRPALYKLLDERPEAIDMPAAGISPSPGSLVFWVDRDAIGDSR